MLKMQDQIDLLAGDRIDVAISEINFEKRKIL